ncbi:MAG: TIGR02444 family protein [Gammaproteobacteria bacterium]|nr:TIGR02444 family protein [Gammaproteobacteria bacterium]
MFELPKSEFWDFSLSVYKQPEVSGACLQLQDEHGANINMMLFACWLGNTGRGVVDIDEWRAMIRRTTHWRDKVIRPLRSVRRFLRDEQLAPLSMKDNILKSEFDAEHIEQLILEKEWGMARAGQTKEALLCLQDIADNLYNYFAADDIELDEGLGRCCEGLIGLITGNRDSQVLHQASRQALTGRDNR